MPQLHAPAVDGEELLKHTLVFSCPFVFACSFHTFEFEEFNLHLAIAHGDRLDSAAQIPPRPTFWDDATGAVFHLDDASSSSRSSEVNDQSQGSA